MYNAIWSRMNFLNILVMQKYRNTHSNILPNKVNGFIFINLHPHVDV